MSDTEVLTTETTNGSKRGRGRPKREAAVAKPKPKPADNGVSNGDNDSGSDTAVQPKKRGRKPAAKDKPVKEQKTSAAETVKRGRGRPKKTASKGRRGRKPAKKAESSEEEADNVDDSASDEDKDVADDE